MYREYWNIFVKQYGGLRLGVVVSFVTMAVSLLEGLNIGLLIPLLESLQSSDEGNRHWISRIVARIFESLGLPFELWTILLALGLLILVISGLKYLRLILVGRMVRNFMVWMRTWVMGNLLHADISYFHAQTLGMLTDTLTTQTARAGNSLTLLANMAATLGVMIAYLAAALIITPTLTLVALGMLFLVSLVVQFLINKAKAISTVLVDREMNFQAAGLENLSGIHMVKSFVLERSRGKAFTEAAQAVGDSSYYLMKNRSQVLVLQELILFGLIGGIVAVGVSILKLDITLIVALLFILYRLMPRITSLNTDRQTLLLGMASLQAVKQAAEDTAKPNIVSGENPFEQLQQCIQFQNVNFSYNQSVQILEETTFTIEKGKMTAIVGSSGAGKSTIVNLLLRFYDPSKGSVLVDGVDLRELDLDSWRNSIGVVSQDVFLFNDTIFNNIALGQRDADMDGVVAAAQQAYAHEFIQELPDGYETQVGDRGWNLSGGQSQRIALSRAIFKNPEILILDEATSSLDSESEQLIQNYLRAIRGTCTLVVVAHRLSTIQDADKIVVLKEGRIVEEGKFDSLLDKSGLFANYQRLQTPS